MTDTDIELDDLTGVGGSTAESLADDGYNVESVANADPDALDDYLAPGVDPEDVIEDAAGVIESDDTDESETTTVSSDQTEDESEQTEDESEQTGSAVEEDEVLHEVDFTLIDEHPGLEYAVVRAVLETELDYRRGTGNREKHDAAKTLYHRLVDQFENDGPYQYPFNELTILYTALRDEKNRLNQRSGVSRYAGQVKSLMDDVQDVRRENFPDN
jgi:hypothetical protein